MARYRQGWGPSTGHKAWEDELARRAAPVFYGCGCDGERLLEGWLSAGCKVHRPVESATPANNWERHEV